MTKVVNIKFEHADVVCGRGTIYGNYYLIGRDGTRDEVCDKYHKEFHYRIKKDSKFKAAILRLKDKTIGCFCKEPDKEIRCHLDTIKEYLDNL